MATRQLADTASYPKHRKVAILGSRSVGKSSLACRFVEGVFVDSYYPTIENTFTKDIMIKNQHFMTEIIDTAGQETSFLTIVGQNQDEYSILNSKHFIGIHGYMLVYSVASKASFDMIGVIRDKILQHTGHTWLPIIIVGNKCDLRPEQRQVTVEEGKKLAADWNAAYIEASARYDENVTQAFQNLIIQVEKGEKPDEPADGGKCAVM